MRGRFQTTALFAVSILFAGCSAKDEAKPVDNEKLKTEIQGMEDAYAAAEKAKDADGVVAYYSDDAISYNRNEEPTSGKAAIRERTAKRMAKDSSGNHNVYKVVDLFSEGNTAVEVGSWTEVNPAGAEVNKGHYMSYFQKRDGKYVCVRDMSVSSMPCKAPM
jgi:ketosteroid isomerase-like protein